jgi:hypothetical protein
MANAAFDEVRRVPHERAQVFVPELQLIAKLKQTTEEVRANIRLPDDTFLDALNKMYPQMPQQLIQPMRQAIQRLRHLDQLDPTILVIAAYYYVRYPNGLNGNAQPQQGSLGRAETFNNKEFDDNAKLAVGDKKSPESFAKIKADILTYYYSLVIG